jgi:hypothetical protein
MESNADGQYLSASNRTQCKTFCRALASVLFALPLCASAALGGVSASSEADRAAMNGSMRVLPGAKYTVHEIETPSGTKIREYVSPAGNIFAVGWDGPVMPNLRQTLGNYFDRYTAAASGVQVGRRQIEVREPDFVVQARGHMRAFSGTAYLPQALPEGVTPEELR